MDYKRMLLFFNFLVSIGGLVIASLAGWAFASTHLFKEMITEGPGMNTTVFVIIAAGIVFCLIGFLGCYGTIHESKTLLMIFSALLLCALAVEGYNCAQVFTKLSATETVIYNSMKQYNAQNHNPTSSIFTITTAWDFIHKKLDCCGYNDAGDWEDAGFIVPPSCNKDMYSNGCKYSFTKYYNTLGSVCITLLAVQVFTMICSCCLIFSPPVDHQQTENPV